MKPILEIQNISKKFRIGGDRGGYKTLRDSLFSKGVKEEDKGEFWALQDVSFDVFPGDTIGIIGKNGAGKSTLLKILSRITPPTKGKIICRGRIASLLEVGTGFHGELSGRENIYLNGSILGLKKVEINKKFDEIVAFSGVEKFLDTPLKHYSSGMQLRLAFAVAAHLEPEILIIDEVLAVGDAEFQKKCLGKMDEISKEQGRTILFVSHNLNQLSLLCREGLVLDEGKLIHSGNIANAISLYSNKISKNYSLKNAEENKPFLGLLKLNQLIINNSCPIKELDEIEIIIEMLSGQKIEELILGFSFTDAASHVIIECRSTATFSNLTIEKTGVITAKCKIKPNLKAGIYSLNIGARYKHGLIFYLPNLSVIEILPKDTSNLEWYKPSNGYLLLDSKWEIK